MTVDDVRTTSEDKVAGTIRLILAALFLMTGAMKLAVPMLADAFSGQLLAASLPLYSIARWAVPVVEIILGAVLAAGYFARPASFVVVGMMAVATYVHLAVEDPSLFPLQPSEPIIPLAVIALSAYILWRGAGAWSVDLKATLAES